MDDTANSDGRIVRTGRRGLLAVVLLGCCAAPTPWPSPAAAQQVAQPEPGRSGPERAPAISAPVTTAGADAMASAARLLSGPRGAPDDASYGHTLVETARAVGRSGELETALQLLTMAVEHYRSGPLAGESRAILTAQLGISSAAWQLGKHDLVIQHASELLRLPSDPADLAQRAAAQQLLAKSLQSTGQLKQALDVVAQLAQGPAAAQLFAAEHVLMIGGAGLRSGQPAVATEAYQFYLDRFPQGARAADAVLGVAWAASLGTESPERAQQRLADFVAAYGDHHDVPHALRAQANLLGRLGRSADAQRVAIDVIERFPASEAVPAVLDDLLASAPPPWPAAIRAAWLDRLRGSASGGGAAGRGAPLRTQCIAQLLVAALASGDDVIWQATVEALVQSDTSGSQTRLLLESLGRAADESLPPGSALAPARHESPGGADERSDVATRLSTGSGHVAEHLAIDLLGRIVARGQSTATAGQSVAEQSPPAVPAACESACRWAGSMGRWSMLALVAEQLSPAGDVPPQPAARARSLAIDRIMAESLMQTRRSKEALAWWDTIIDVQGADDFATLLRGAEAAVAHGSLDSAAARLLAASGAAGDDSFNLSLVRILEAELAVRRARMDEARDLLAAIVRATEAVPPLRCRAQWLIGETYFLQTRYAEAIDAYRRVDALDAEGEWAAASLLQAGKAFEKLARSREAATCYTALLSRFGDTPHAAQARGRLAQLGGHDAAEEPLRR